MSRSFKDFNSPPNNSTPSGYTPFEVEPPDNYSSSSSTSRKTPTRKTPSKSTEDNIIPLPPYTGGPLPPPRSSTKTNTSNTSNKKVKKKGLIEGASKIINLVVLLGSMGFSALLVNHMSPDIEQTRLSLEQEGKQQGALGFVSDLESQKRNNSQIRYDRAYIVSSTYLGPSSTLEVILYSNDLSIVHYAELFGTADPLYVYADVVVKDNQLLFGKKTEFQPPSTLLDNL